jgi:hypothetical protein
MTGEQWRALVLKQQTLSPAMEPKCAYDAGWLEFPLSERYGGHISSFFKTSLQGLVCIRCVLLFGHVELVLVEGFIVKPLK